MPELSNHAFELILAIGTGLGVVVWHIVKKMTDALMANTAAMIRLEVVVSKMDKDVESLKERNPQIEKMKSDQNAFFERLRALEQFNQTKEI